ncbi:linalool dehydratase/isomerase domain-containing protein [Microbulbifer epialgicus]|uniref:Linalool dehydratase/isomerase domain-containing protein n=1 Tax=Microbulbifer epialgicus TaxID=393907 RepID=A0ABV4P1Y2_9GAMM
MPLQQTESLPKLSANQLGLIQHLVRIAHQLPGDWSFMGALEPGQEGGDSYRYQLNAIVCALASAQYHWTPAYRELYQKAIQQLIQKMLRFDVWGYWELTSRGGILCDPEQEELSNGWVDPVIHKNVMYSGPLLNMLYLYEMLYRDGKYHDQKAICFEYHPLFRGMGSQDFNYSQEQILDAALKDLKCNDFLGCESEPNLISPFCNQYLLLALMLHDKIHGTLISPEIMKRHKSAWVHKTGLYKKSADDLKLLPLMYMVRQELPVIDSSSASALAVTMHPWNREYAEYLYMEIVESTVKDFTDKSKRVDVKVELDLLQNQSGYPDPARMGISIFGFTLLAVSEMGDKDTLGGLLQFVEEHFSPTREHGHLYYRRCDDLSSASYATRLSTNGLIPWAQLNPRDGLWQIYNRPWDQEQLAAPEVTGINYPSVLVTQARYDSVAKCIKLAFQPGETPPPRVEFTIQRWPSRVALLSLAGENSPIRLDNNIDHQTKSLHVDLPFTGPLEMTIDTRADTVMPGN